MAITNRILFRRSGTLKTFFKLENTGWLPGGFESTPRRRGSAVGELVALDRRATLLVRRRQERDATACGRDGCIRGLRHGVRGELHGDGDSRHGRAPSRSVPLRTRPAATSTSGVTTVSPSSLSWSRLTGLYSTRNGLLKPFSLGTRCLSGIWPPSKPRATLPRPRDFWPLVPAPAVLPPLPPIPRPTRFLALRAAGCG
jgi:hypothetical protein